MNYLGLFLEEDFLGVNPNARNPAFVQEFQPTQYIPMNRYVNPQQFYPYPQQNPPQYVNNHPEFLYRDPTVLLEQGLGFPQTYPPVTQTYIQPSPPTNKIQVNPSNNRTLQEFPKQKKVTPPQEDTSPTSSLSPPTDNENNVQLEMRLKLSCEPTVKKKKRLATEPPEESEENRAARFAKKREATVKREQDRRFRMNLYLDKLKELIPGRVSHDPKATKEAILMEAIEYIEKMRMESRVIKYAKIIPNDPFNTQGILQEELDVGFNIMYGVENQVLQKIEGKGQLILAFQACQKVKDLAQKSIRDEHQLCAYTMQIVYRACLDYNGKEIQKIYNEALPVLQRVTEKHGIDGAPIKYKGIELGTVMMCHYAYAIMHFGMVDESVRIWNEAFKRSRESKHKSSEMFVNMFRRTFTSVRGDKMKLSDGKIVYEITKNEIAWEGMGKLCLASAILENTATEYERKQAMDMLNEVKFALSNIKAIFGSLAFCPVLGTYLHVLAASDPHQALREIDKVIKTLEGMGIFNLWTESDLCRMKGELLLKVADTPENRAEAKTLFKKAIDAAYIDESKPRLLKSLAAMVKLQIALNDTAALSRYSNELSQVYDFVRKMCTKEDPGFMIAAQELIINPL